MDWAFSLGFSSGPTEQFSQPSGFATRVACAAFLLAATKYPGSCPGLLSDSIGLHGCMEEYSVLHCA